MAECRFDGDLESIEVFGNGVTIWNSSRQFVLPKSSVVAILDLVQSFGFSELEAIYGDDEAEVPIPQAADPAGSTDGSLALQVACRIEISVDEISKGVVQLAKGEQSQKLRDLAAAIREICAPAAQTGLSAENLLDGLRKVAEARLAPETLEIILMVKPGRGSAETRAWQLTLRGPRARLRDLDSREADDLELPRDEVARLAADLAATAPTNLPENLFSSRYLDLRITVLNHHLAVQARQFAGMAPRELGEAQLRFDHLVARLEELARTIETTRPA